LPVDVNNYKLSPDGRRVLLSLDVFTDCKTLACTRKRLDARKKNKASGRLYKRVFVQNWIERWTSGQ
jgi:hypothetical protein